MLSSYQGMGGTLGSGPVLHSLTQMGEECTTLRVRTCLLTYIILQFSCLLLLLLQTLHIQHSGILSGSTSITICPF